MSTRSAGCKLDQAQAAYARAFNALGLGRGADYREALQEAQAAIELLRADCPGESDFGHAGSAFVAASLLDTDRLIGRLRSAGAARSDVAISLLAVDFLLRAVQAQQEAAARPTVCINCSSTHLVARDGGTAEAPLYQCTDCGLTAPYQLVSRC